jgi:hypothetical protein
MTQCSLPGMYWRLEGTFIPYIQLEIYGSMYLRNNGIHLPDYTVS